MTRKHLLWGWSCRGFSRLESATSAFPEPGPRPASCRTLSLLSAGLFKISSMEKDRPSFFGASQHPEFCLSVAPQRAGTTLFAMGSCQEG